MKTSFVKFWSILFATNKFVVALVSFALGSLLFFFFKDNTDGKNMIMYGILIFSYYSYHNLGKAKWEQFSRGILIGMASMMLMILIISTLKTIHSSEQFDFMCFYLQGKLGLNHLPFYDPNSFNIYMAQSKLHVPVNHEIKLEILNVGLLTPPISMLFFAPLAYLDYQTARTTFAILVFLFIIIDSILANRLFLQKSDRSNYSQMLIFILMMLLPGTISTIFYVQSNFFILFFLLLFLLNINKSSSAIYLALSLVFKPITGLLSLFYLLGKKFKPFFIFCATCVVLFLITGFIWGFNNIVDFFISPPTQRLPHYLYSQGVNQSILAILNRNLSSYNLPDATISIFFFTIAGAIILLSCIASRRLLKVDSYVSFFPLILCALLIYPSSLSHYMVYLVPVLVYFILLRKNDKYFWIIIIPFFTFLRTEAFFSYIILWLFFMYLGIIKSENITHGKMQTS